jgi:hypothetical protein
MQCMFSLEIQGMNGRDFNLFPYMMMLSTSL